MPLFKTNDFWMPNTFYYATERYKSVIEYNNQLYVCTDTHKSEDTFNTSKFNTLSGSGGSLVENLWDIDATTITNPPTTVNIKLNDTLDATFNELGNQYTITANTNLTKYPIGTGYIFGGSKYNIELLDNEYKEIIIKDFNTVGYDYLLLIFSSLDFQDILPYIGNDLPLKSLTITLASFGGGGQIVVSLNDDVNTIYIDSSVASTNELFDVRVRVNENVIEVYLNNDLIVYKNFLGEPIETWQSYLGVNVNLYLLTFNVPTLLPRNSITYEMPLPFTVVESTTTVNPPDNANDGDLFKLTSAGIYNGFNLSVNDRVIFQNNLQDLILIPENINLIPSLELEIFKNKIYERGIIDNVLLTTPVNLTTLPIYYTFWVLDESKLYSINKYKQKILIDILDNTFRIMDSGLILSRNDTGMSTPSNSIQPISDVNYGFLVDMLSKVDSIGLQISEENLYRKRIKEVSLDETNTYAQLYLGDDLGNYNYVFINESITSATLVISNTPYNLTTVPAYNSIKENLVIVENRTLSDKLLTINNAQLLNLSSNNISIKPFTKILIELKSNYNVDISEFNYTTAIVKNVESLNKTLYVADEPINYCYTHIEDIIVNSTLPTVTITGQCNTSNTHKYKIYNNGNTVDVNMTINGILHTFNIPSFQSREMLILEETAPNTFTTGVYQ